MYLLLVLLYYVFFHVFILNFNSFCYFSPLLVFGKLQARHRTPSSVIFSKLESKKHKLVNSFELRFPSFHPSFKTDKFDWLAVFKILLFTGTVICEPWYTQYKCNEPRFKLFWPFVKSVFLTTNSQLCNTKEPLLLVYLQLKLQIPSYRIASYVGSDGFSLLLLIIDFYSSFAYETKVIQSLSNGGSAFSMSTIVKDRNRMPHKQQFGKKIKQAQIKLCYCFVQYLYKPNQCVGSRIYNQFYLKLKMVKIIHAKSNHVRKTFEFICTMSRKYIISLVRSVLISGSRRPPRANSGLHDGTT